MTSSGPVPELGQVSVSGVPSTPNAVIAHVELRASDEGRGVFVTADEGDAVAVAAPLADAAAVVDAETVAVTVAVKLLLLCAEADGDGESESVSVAPPLPLASGEADGECEADAVALEQADGLMLPHAEAEDEGESVLVVVTDAQPLFDADPVAPPLPLASGEADGECEADAVALEQADELMLPHAEAEDEGDSVLDVVTDAHPLFDADAVAETDATAVADDAGLGDTVADAQPLADGAAEADGLPGLHAMCTARPLGSPKHGSPYKALSEYTVHVELPIQAAETVASTSPASLSHEPATKPHAGRRPVSNSGVPYDAKRTAEMTSGGSAAGQASASGVPSTPNAVMAHVEL